MSRRVRATVTWADGSYWGRIDIWARLNSQWIAVGYLPEDY